jgi:hypothetical protein
LQVISAGAGWHRAGTECQLSLFSDMAATGVMGRNAPMAMARPSNPLSRPPEIGVILPPSCQRDVPNVPFFKGSVGADGRPSPENAASRFLLRAAYAPNCSRVNFEDREIMKLPHRRQFLHLAAGAAALPAAKEHRRCFAPKPRRALLRGIRGRAGCSYTRRHD